MGFKLEFPKRIKNKSFLSEVYEVTTRQFFPLKNPNQKTIFGGSLRGLYVFAFFPHFCLAYAFIAIYIAVLRLFKK